MRLVSICIATYRRPAGLTQLLDSIEEQDLPGELAVEVIVVDNDPPTAEALVANHAAGSRFPFRYLVQAKPNISLTRNIGVAAAGGDLIWFVDDDEVADPACLSRLFSAMEAYDADVVYGPVLPAFDRPPADWLMPLYERPIHPTGTRSEAHRTSNTLVRTKALRGVDGPFDASYGITGGSDTMLFRQLEADGLLLIESDDAFVTEFIPPERSTWQWLRSRMRRHGQNHARQAVTLAGSRWSPAVIVMAAKAALQVAMWAAMAMARWPNRGQRAKHLLRMWTNVGKLEGVSGVTTRRDP